MPILLTLLAVAAIAVPGAAYLWPILMPAAAEASAPIAATPAPVPVVAPVAAVTGTASITSNPAGAQVTIDGEPRGATPLRLSLAPGTYTVELRSGATTREQQLTVEAGRTAEAFTDLAPSLAASGRLHITSDPPGAEITIDGTARGTTPLVLAAVQPGQHRVVISDGVMTVNRTVDVVPGTTVNVSATMSRAASANGWISVNSPLPLQVWSGGRLLGETGERIPVRVGTYELDLVSEAFGFKTTATARVQGGQTADVPVALPNGTLSVNAVPWAEVWIDGRSLGQTPLGRVAVPIGEHEVIWRHPQFGERRQTVRITPDNAVRVGVDFNR